MNDDWVYMERAHSLGFWRFVFQNYNGHVMPGCFFIVWLVAKSAPLSHGAVVVVTALWSAAAGLCWVAALRELCGERIRTLVVLLLVVLTPLSIQATIWWASAVQFLALQTTLALCVYLTTRLARHPQRGTYLALLLVYGIGLLMWEKNVLLLVPILGVLTVVADGSLRERWNLLRGHVLGLVGVTAGYAVLYLVAVRDQSMSLTPIHMEWDRGALVVASSLWRLGSRLLAPAAMGGPWNTLPVDKAPHLSAPLWLGVTTTSLVVALTLLCILTRRSGFVAAAMVALYGGLAWGLIVFSSRYDMLGLTEVGIERFAVDIFSVACVGLAMTLMPQSGPSALAAPLFRVHRITDLIQHGFKHRATAITTLALVAASVVTADATAISRIGISPARAWVDNLSSDLGGRGSVTIVDDYAPQRVLFPPFWGSTAKLSCDAVAPRHQGRLRRSG